MKRALPIALLLVGALAPGVSVAQSGQPTNEEINAFIDAYRVLDSLKIVTDEVVTRQVEKGKLSADLAKCMKEKAPLDEVRKIIAPVIAKSFPDPDHLRAATAFLSSPTGRKLTDYDIAMFKETIRNRLHGKKTPEVGKPSDFSAEDTRVAAAFNDSPAGAAFSRFVHEGLPKIRRVDLLGMTWKVCSK